MATKDAAEKEDSAISERHPRILVLAYACDPYGGSEAGAGWAMVRAAADLGDVTALISQDYAEAVERWVAQHPESQNVRFVPIGSPDKGSVISRMIRIDRRAGFLAYIRWLPVAGRTARLLHSESPFDVSVHGGYGAYWLPSPLVDLESVPCVWGPVGGGTRTPRRLWRYLGLVGWLGEIQKSLVLAVATRLAPVRRTWQRAAIRLFETPETLDAMPKRYRDRADVLNRVLLYDLPENLAAEVGRARTNERQPVMLFPSSLEPRKGPMLALHALTHTPDEVRLVFANEGYAQRWLERAAVRLGIAHRVDFLGRIPRNEMLKMVRQSSAVVFAGLREVGGMALVEAMMLGAPVVVLSHGGPRVIVDKAIDTSRVAAISPSSYQETAARMGAAMTAFVRDPPTATSCNLDSQSKETLHAAIQRAHTETQAAP